MIQDGGDGGTGSRLAEARQTARALVDALESGVTMITECLLKAQRLARLQRDTDAQTWLRLELSGYPADFDGTTLGWCAKYAWRFGEGGKVIEASSLPALEANISGMQVVLGKLSGPAISAPVQDRAASVATLQVMKDANQTLVAHRNALANVVAQFQRLKANVHAYATDVLIALELGDMAESLFEQARARIDAFVSARCPQAAEQLLAMNDRVRDGDSESRSAALNSCRRLINAVADQLYPPDDRPYLDANGKERDVGREAYKNRLIAYVEQRLQAGSNRRLLTSELKHLVDRLDALYEKACKGVHDDVSLAEVHVVILQTYVFLGELAQLAEGESSHGYRGQAQTSSR